MCAEACHRLHAAWKQTPTPPSCLNPSASCLRRRAGCSPSLRGIEDVSEEVRVSIALPNHAALLHTRHLHMAARLEVNFASASALSWSCLCRT